MSDLRSLPGIHDDGDKNGKSGTAVKLLVVVGLIVGGAVVYAIAFSGSDSSSTTPTDDTSKYTQSWPKQYSDTTCTEWSTDLSPSQRFAASADMLTGARNKGDGGTGLPADSMIDDFSVGISSVCVEPTMSITDAAVGLYLTEPIFQP